MASWYLSTTKQKKTQIWLDIKRVIWDRAYIKVTYAKDFWNDGYYENDERLLSALSAFTEKSLTDEFGI